MIFSLTKAFLFTIFALVTLFACLAVAVGAVLEGVWPLFVFFALLSLVGFKGTYFGSVNIIWIILNKNRKFGFAKMDYVARARVRCYHK